MIPMHTIRALKTRLPTLKTNSPGTVYLGHCPFHASTASTLVVDFETDSVACMTCGYGGTVAMLSEDTKTVGSAGDFAPNQGGKFFRNHALARDDYGHLVSREVSQAIHSHLFSSKLKELNSAVDQLAQLISRMKLWIDPK